MSYTLRIQVTHPDLLDLYKNHSTYHEGDAGLDLFVPETTVIPARARGYILNLGIQCEMVHSYDVKNYDVGDLCIEYNRETKFKNTSYCLYPRSSLGAKTPLRLANCVGIIDAGYRGPICAILDNLSDEDYTVSKGERLVQICRPNLKSFSFRIVDTLSSSERGENGIGSTSKSSEPEPLTDSPGKYFQLCEDTSSHPQEY